MVDFTDRLKRVCADDALSIRDLSKLPDSAWKEVVLTYFPDGQLPWEDFQVLAFDGGVIHHLVGYDLASDNEIVYLHLIVEGQAESHLCEKECGVPIAHRLLGRTDQIAIPSTVEVADLGSLIIKELVNVQDGQVGVRPQFQREYPASQAEKDY